MPSNKYLIPDKSLLLKTKLDKLSKKLQGSLGTTELQTKEQYIFEAVKILGEFYKDLTEPQLGTQDILNVRSDDLPDPELYNTLWNKLLDDLTTIFTELENIEQLTLGNFNYITTESNRLTARLKKVSSLVGDYILYSLNPNRDSIYFKDSFNDLSKIDIGSALINTEECEINQVEGIVTLPIDKTQDSSVPMKESPIINPNSNGVAGNNQELGAEFNGDLSVLLDNNPDTWFEYERVVSRIGQEQDALILDITMNLGEERVINFVRINPNNFGTKTVIKIDTIETSLDGQVYTSIKDDIPIAGFVEEDEENVFTLAPSSSKFAGQGLYTFTPRKAKYIHFVFRQTEAYTIQTSVGERLRYAIGIRDIDIRNLKYKNVGEIVSTRFETTDEIRKVLLESNQNPKQLSELASIQWFVSPDDGSTWNEIQPKEFEGFTGVESTPEILEFNGPSEDTIVTPVPVNSVRVRALLTRNDDSFIEGSSSFNKVIENTSETHQVPLNSPFSIELVNPPVDGSIVVIDPGFGSRGKPESQYILGHSTDGIDLRKFRLPFKTLPRPQKKVLVSANKWKTEPVPASEWMHIEVGGEEWDHITQAFTNYGPNDKVFYFDIERGILEFGNGTDGAVPPLATPIGSYFDAERIFPSSTQDDHLAKLDFTTSNNRDDVVLKRYDEIEDATELLPRRATVIRLENQNITDTTNIATKINAMLATGTQVTFLNGKDEFIAPNADKKWSIDTEAGIIYLGSPTPDTDDVSISYKFQPIHTLEDTEWDWGTTNILRDSVTIKESAWKTTEVLEETVAIGNGVTVFDVAKMGVVKGTLSFDLLDGLGDPVEDNDPLFPFLKEVDFINGVQELGSRSIKTTEQLPANVAPVANVVTYDLKENITKKTEADALFTNTVLFDPTKFIPSDGNGTPTGVPDAVGEYSINTNPASAGYGEVKVFSTTSPAAPGYITYFYDSPTFSNNGLYSVDYKNGKVYTQRAMQTGWTLKVTYDYTEYRAEYRIARLLDPRGYDVDIVNATITIKDSEILKFSNTPKSAITSRPPTYIVNYDFVGETRENIDELKDSFSPTIKDYALRVLTKGKIF